MEATTPKAEAEANVPPSTAEPDPWREIRWLPCTLSVALPIPNMKVRDLLTMTVDTVLDSQQPVAASLPVWVNGVMIGRAEFDVVGTRLSVLINELR